MTTSGKRSVNLGAEVANALKVYGEAVDEEQQRREAAAYERAFDEPSGWESARRCGPRGPAERASDRAREHEVLALAYRLASGVAQPLSDPIQQARTLLVEALKAWERAHPPAALDPLLLPQVDPQEIPGVTRRQRVPQPGDLDYPEG